MGTLLLLAQNADVGVAVGGGLVLLVVLLIGLLGLILTIWALVSAVTNPAIDGTMKIVWVLVILFAFPPLGAIIYLIVGRKTGNRPYASP